MKGGMPGFSGTACIRNCADYIPKSFMDLPVINTQTNNCFYFFFYHIGNKRIVISFINSAQYQDRWLLHAFQCIPGAVYISSLAVIDKFDSSYCCYIFHPVLQTFKGLYSLTDFFFFYIKGGSGQGSSHCIVLIVLSFQSKIKNTHSDMVMTRS